MVARQLTENPYDMVDSGEEIYSEELTITSDYIDYDILEEEKDIITKNNDVWVKTKRKYVEE